MRLIRHGVCHPTARTNEAITTARSGWRGSRAGLLTHQTAGTPGGPEPVRGRAAVVMQATQFSPILALGGALITNDAPADIGRVPITTTTGWSLVVIPARCNLALRGSLGVSSNGVLL